MGQCLTYNILSDRAQLFALEDDWREIYRSAERCFTASFQWCSVAWRDSATPCNQRLHCIVGQEGDHPVLIWPFVVYRRGPWMIAGPLGHHTTEYSDVLVRPGRPHAEDILGAWSTLRATAGCDVIRLPCVRGGSALAEVLPILARRHALTSCVQERVTSFIDWSGSKNWDTYYRSLDRKQRRDIARRRRRLQESGEVTFTVTVTPDESAAIIDWLFETKIAAIEHKGKKQHAGLHSDQYRNLLKSVVAASNGPGGLIVSALKLDDKIIAAAISRIGNGILEAVLTTFDPRAHVYSPSHCLYEELLRWAFEHNLKADLRFGEEDFKSYWGVDTRSAFNCDFALSAKGLAFVAGRTMSCWRQRQAEMTTS